MNRALWLAALFVTAGPLPCWAQFGGGGRSAKPPEKWKVEVKMDDERTFEGILSLGSLDVDSDVGHYAIKPEKIKEVVFVENRQDVHPSAFQGTIVTTTGEKFAGSIRFPPEGIETDLGTLRPYPIKLRSLTFKGRPPA